MADINKEASWVTARLMEISNATQDGTNILITNANLGNFVPSDVVRTSAQTLTDAERQQARTNIGAASTSALNSAIVELDSELIALENGKVDKPEDATPGNVAIIGSNGNIEDGGHKFSDAFPVGSASGSIVTIEDGADGIPLKSMTVQIVPVQAGSGDPSPTNIRAITGFTSAKINRTARNLLKPMLTEAKTVRGVTFTPHEDGSITGSGTSTNSINGSYIKFGVVNLKGGYDYWAGNFVQPTGTIGDFPNLQLANDVTNSAIYRIKNGGYSYSIDADRTVRLNPMGSSSTNFDNTVFYPMFSIKSQGTEFEPYKGNVYEIEFPSEAGTVYGGELTVNEDGSGTLVSDWRYARLQGTVTQYPGTGYELMYYMTSWQDGKLHINGNGASYEASYRMCNMLKSVPNVATAKTDRGTFSFAEGSTTAVNMFYGVYPDGVTSASEMTTWLTNNEVYIAYKLQTPVVYQLTAEQVQTLLFKTLKGLNNIWADTGDISVEYHADPTIFVEEKTKAIKQSIAPVEDGYTASQAYTVGSFLYVGDTLYKVTSAIASGATITPGTNVTATTVSEQLMALA